MAKVVGRMVVDSENMPLTVNDGNGDMVVEFHYLYDIV